MFTPKSVFALLVLTYLVASCLGEIVDNLKVALILPLWQKLIGSGADRLILGKINVAPLLGLIVISVLGLLCGICLLVILMRVGWPLLSRSLRLEKPGK